MEPTLREILGPKKLMREIAEEICRESGLTLVTLMSRSNKPKIARARHAAFLRCHQVGHSQSEIARFFDRDHTTVLYGLRCAQRGWAKPEPVIRKPRARPIRVLTPQRPGPASINYRACQRRWEERADGVWFGPVAKSSPLSTSSRRDRSNTMGVTCAILGE